MCTFVKLEIRVFPCVEIYLSKKISTVILKNEKS